MSIRFLLISFAALLSACASVHPGQVGRSTGLQAKLPLKVSAQNIEGESNDGLQLIEMTLENTSGEWLKFDKATIAPMTLEESKISAVLGSDLKSWAQAAAAKQKVEEQNRAVVQGGLIIAGTVASIIGGSRNPGLATAGAAVVVGTYAWAVTDAVNASIKDAERSEKVPENHLYRSSAIAPKMFLRRWLLIKKPVGEKVKNLSIDFETVEGEKETYALSI